MHYLKNYYSHEWHVARYIDYLSRFYRGNYCEYEFVAQILYSGLFLPEVDEEKIVRYIVAAPLYVKQARILGRRTLISVQGRKYILTSAEYKAHMRNEFDSLSTLLREEGLKEEAAELDKKLNDIYTLLKKLVSTERHKRFLDRAVPIVKEYVYIVS